MRAIDSSDPVAVISSHRAVDPVGTTESERPVAPDRKRVRLLEQIMCPGQKMRYALAAVLITWIAGKCASLWITEFIIIPAQERAINWIVLPWAIPCPGYIVRRCLIGEVTTYLSVLFDIDVRLVVYITVLVSSLLFALCIWRLFKNNFGVAAPLILSPAALPFFVTSSVTGMEIPLVLHFSFACVLAAMGRYLLYWWTLWVAAVLWPFVHEGLALFVPYFLLVWAAYGTGRLPRLPAALFLVLWLAAVGSAALVSQYHRGPDVVEDICIELVNAKVLVEQARTVAQCMELDWMHFYRSGFLEAVSETLSFVSRKEGGVFIGYSRISFVWSVLWILGVSFALWTILARLSGYEIRRLGTVSFPLVAPMAAPLALFALGWDWGRWISISYFMIVLLALGLVRPVRLQAALPGVGDRTQPYETWMAVGWWLLVLQPLFWRFDVQAAIKPGLLGLVLGRVAELLLAVVTPR